MNSFIQAIDNTRNVTRTENGGVTFDTSTDACVDLFFNIGAARSAMRTIGKSKFIGNFVAAYEQDPETAIKIMLWTRDVRGGAGERQIFRVILSYVEKYYPQYLEGIVNIIPEIGRWDDLLTLETEQGRALATSKIRSALNQRNGLCAKWMPRKGKVAARLRSDLGWSPKFYRKTLVNLTNVVEQKMCSNQWDEINFEHVPSLAASRYQRAFATRAPMAYAKYCNSLSAGTAKINSGAVYPYDVIKSLTTGNTTASVAQWEALPNYLEGSTERLLPMVDVSGSMDMFKISDSTSVMTVALGLGLYLADKAPGEFKDTFLTFSSRSRLQHLRGDLVAKLNQMRSSDWGMSTSLESAFKEILAVATANRVDPDQMPTMLVVLSDMEFDYAGSQAPMDYAARSYEEEGYKLPKVVFWNLAARSTEGNVPVRFDEDGVALVSGFSPSIMKSILSGDDFSPRAIMQRAISDPRYDIFS